MLLTDGRRFLQRFAAVKVSCLKFRLNFFAHPGHSAEGLLTKVISDCGHMNLPLTHSGGPVDCFSSEAADHHQYETSFCHYFFSQCPLANKRGCSLSSPRLIYSLWSLFMPCNISQWPIKLSSCPLSHSIICTYTSFIFLSPIHVHANLSPNQEVTFKCM